MSRENCVNKIIGNYITNNNNAEKFIDGLAELGLAPSSIETRFRFDLDPVCEFFSIPAGWSAKKGGTRNADNWALVKTCANLISYIYEEDHMENVIAFLQNLQKAFSKSSVTSSKNIMAITATEFFDMFSIDELTHHIAHSRSPLMANDYKNDIVYRLPDLTNGQRTAL